MSYLTKFKAAAKESGLEDQFLKAAGLSSMDELSPANFRDIDSESPAPKLTPAVKPDANLNPAPAVPKTTADAAPGPSTPQASDFLFPFLTTSIVRQNRKRASYYHPSSIFMFYILHQMNELLCDNFYFKRSCPDYHPLVLRLYFGIIFCIQVLRAHATAMSPGDEEHEFLLKFLDTHRLETLAIPGPLLSLFKTLSSSQPEFGVYGKVYPRLPSPLGPTAYSSLFALTSEGIVGIPAIPGIFAMLSCLNALINAATPSYPKKGWTPITGSTTTDETFQGSVYAHHTPGTGTTPMVNNFSNQQAWYLHFPGLDYGCEAPKALNEAFAERYDEYGFPTFTATSDLSATSAFLGKPHLGDWFNKVKEVAASAAAYFEGSGTLADCAPSGPMSNQVIVSYQAPDTVPTKPTKMSDPASRFPFAYRLSTTSRTVPQMFEAMSAAGQTHARMFASHPYFVNLGRDAGRVGPFWAIRPIDQSQADDSSYLSTRSSVKKALKLKV